MRARHLATLVLVTGLVATPVFAQEDPNDIFIVRTTSKTPDAIVAAIKSHSDEKKWEYLGESKIKKGEVTLVKICIPAVGQLLWPVGLQLSAMLPCGNVGIYQKGTATEISVLHPRYMHTLYPHPSTERASAVAQPLLMEMLDAVTK
jgi:hypothetical protein